MSKDRPERSWIRQIDESGETGTFTGLELPDVRQIDRAWFGPFVDHRQRRKSLNRRVEVQRVGGGHVRVEAVFAFAQWNTVEPDRRASATVRIALQHDAVGPGDDARQRHQRADFEGHSGSRWWQGGIGFEVHRDA